MKKTSLLATLVLLSVSSFSFAATLHSLDKKEVIQALEDKTITTIPLATLNEHLVSNAFTGYFGKPGQVNGQFTNKPDNDPQTDQGTWTVKSDGTLCTTWQHWNHSKEACIALYKLKSGLLFVNPENDSFVSLVLDENIKSGNQMR